MWDDVLSIRGSGNILRLVGQVLELVAQTVCVVSPSGLDCSGLLSLLLTHREKDKKCLLNRTGLAFPTFLLRIKTLCCFDFISDPLMMITQLHNHKLSGLFKTNVLFYIIFTLLLFSNNNIYVWPVSELLRNKKSPALLHIFVEKQTALETNPL